MHTTWRAFWAQPLNFSYFFLRKFTLKNFFIFSQKKKISYISGKWNFLTIKVKTFLYFLKKCFSFISGNRSFRPQNNFLYFLKKKVFLMFREMKLFKKASYISGGNFPISKKKISEIVSYILGNGT